MCATRTTETGQLFNRPSDPIGYVAVLAALVTGVLHLLASTNAVQFSLVLGVLFVLNGLGFIGGAMLYLTRYWRRWLFLVAALYAVATILALFPVQGWGVEAFYMNGSLNPLAVVTKAAEAILAVSAVYLYSKADR
ncbi:DUF7475 family protein [Natronomonas sp.]|uniref:DUF7475 family protein n=1 Tax=Natronomonas sp. TaxID=2184060 RepID=UPI002FC3554E